MWLFAAFIAVPLIEIALFIQVGGLIGLWPTLGVVIVTAIVGTWLVRSQGAAELGRLRRSINDLNDPTEPLAHGAMILVSGALLLTPGFFTDTVGFLLLVPAVRQAALRWVKSRVTVQNFTYQDRPAGPGGRPRPRDTVVDVDYEDVTPDQSNKTPTHQPSGWTRH
ncbi:FxsA family protein [Pelagovum pacificum]|uniref:FxsA family protein n=1 Tax=Pelagovum pacificum TaxID=2588711 RepID=A0A5C5GJU3_9RHOB|nr:FxsA family protein [Pelagovum pacificum]QQA42771.1 FxsA family protein [Pelagovum pacificum]TNY34081.1 FxsA family protein [Pelagovum pacificum]